MALFSQDIEIRELFFARPLPAVAWVIIAAVIIALTFILYRRERGLKPGVRISLLVARIGIFLLLAAAIFEPTALLKETRDEKQSLAVLVDTSKSMSVRDQRKRPREIKEAAAALGFIPLANETKGNETGAELNAEQRNAIAAASRLDLAKSLLSKAGVPYLNNLAEDMNLRYYEFGNSVNMLGDGPSQVNEEITALEAVKQGTSLANSLEQVANANRGDSLSGIIMLSDGIETSTRQPKTVAHDLGVRGIPLYVLPTGIPDPDDISIRNVIVQDVVFVGDTVPVRIQIRSKGYEKRHTQLIVRFDDREVVRQEVVLDGGLQYVDVAFDARAKAKGAAELAIEVQPFMDEATGENNKVAKSLRVVNEKINVLCIEGSARWEFRYLRAILKRDPRINATFIATRAGNELAMNSSDYIARFPEDAEVAFKYDLVVLGDVDPEFFNPGEFLRLEELVRERGGSLLMLAGPKHSPCSYEGTVVERMLPVKFNAAEKWQEVDKHVHPVLTPAGRSSLVLTLEKDRNKNDRIWSHVAPMDRLPPLLEPRPGASVLATLSDSGSRVSQYPLISWQRYGTGKCMLMATDRLWRLRFRTGDKYHWRVWSQCIQFLTLSRLLGEHKPIRLETDRVSYAAGDQVRIYAEVLDDGYEPVLQERYDVHVERVSANDKEIAKRRVRLRPDATRAGLYVGYYTPPGTGRYRIQAGEEDLDRSNTVEFQVADLQSEMAHTEMQRERLQRIAELSGGKYLQLSQLPQLAADFKRGQQQAVIYREKSVWDNWLFAVLIVGLTGFEWIVRRRYDLL